MKLWHRKTTNWTPDRHGPEPLRNPSRFDEAFGFGLSSRELEVLKLIAMGLTNAEIGKQLYVAPETIKSHVRMILAKLGARTRAHAVWLGVVEGWLTTSSPDETSDPSQPSREM